jgi:hypothetical protein
LDEEDFAENLEYCPLLMPVLHARRSLQSLLPRILTREIISRASIHSPPAYRQERQ